MLCQNQDSTAIQTLTNLKKSLEPFIRTLVFLRSPHFTRATEIIGIEASTTAKLSLHRIITREEKSERLKQHLLLLNTVPSQNRCLKTFPITISE